MSDQACTAVASTAPDSPILEGAITVACVHGDPAVHEQLADALDAHDRLTVELTATRLPPIEELDPIDGVVADGEAGPALVERIREHERRMPVVLYTDAPREPLVAAVLGDGLVDLVRPAGEVATELLAHRLATLVDHQRTAALATRATAATAAATDGLAVLGDDGTVRFANEQFARKLGYELAGVHGRAWRDLFDETSVGRLETDALTAVDDGWQWVGTTIGRRADGETVALRTLVTAAEDGAVVIAVLGTDPEN